MFRLSRVPVTIVLLVALAGFAARESLLTAIGEGLMLDEAPRPADVIVVLGGSLPDRMLHAVDLYQQGFAPRIVFGREPESPGMNELRARGGAIPERDELNLSVALQLGVPRAALQVVDGRPSSTVIEAEVLIPELRAGGARTVLLVSSKLHTYRSSLIFRTLAPDLDFVAVATPFDPFEPQRWWQSRGQVRRLVFEYQKLAIFWLRDRWATKPAARLSSAEKG